MLRVNAAPVSTACHHRLTRLQFPTGQHKRRPTNQGAFAAIGFENWIALAGGSVTPNPAITLVVAALTDALQGIQFVVNLRHATPTQSTPAARHASLPPTREAFRRGLAVAPRGPCRASWRILGLDGQRPLDQLPYHSLAVPLFEPQGQRCPPPISALAGGNG